MDDLISFEPDGSGRQKQHQHQRNKSKRAKSHEVLDEQRCLEALSQLPGLVAMGLLTPAQANSIRSTLQAILRHHSQTGSKHSGSALKDIDIMSILRTNPDLVNRFESLLTDEQLEDILREAKDGDDRET